MQIHSIGIDLGKTNFHLVALGIDGRVLIRKKFNQKQLITFTANLQTSLIGMEACSGAHFLGRALRSQGHEVKLIPAQFVKPFVKANKNDFLDAEAIAEAVDRKNMRFNNESLAFVEVEMIAAGIVPFGTELKNPEFSKVAEACGLLGLRVTKPEELGPALDRAMQHDGPALVEVMVHRQELSMPPTITAAQAMGFSLYRAQWQRRCTARLGEDELVDRLLPH